jgi:hypothetical protein
MQLSTIIIPFPEVIIWSGHFPDEKPSTEVPPWDNIREKRYPAWVHLNRLRPEQYREVFASEHDVILFERRDINHDQGGFEGEGLLTPQIEKELWRRIRGSFC